MFKLEPRPQASKFWSYGSPLLALVITVLIGVALFSRSARTRSRACRSFSGNRSRRRTPWAN
jgi:hypothetical protein